MSKDLMSSTTARVLLTSMYVNDAHVPFFKPILTPQECITTFLSDWENHECIDEDDDRLLFELYEEYTANHVEDARHKHSMQHFRDHEI